MYELTEITEPAALPVEHSALEAHLRLGTGFAEPSGEAVLLDRYLAAATAEIEARTGLALVAREFRLTVTRWGPGGCLVLPVGPVSALGAATLAGQPLSGLSLAPGRLRQVVSRAGAALPPIPPGSTAEIAFTAGFGPGAADVPADLAQAVLLVAAHLYDDRPGGAAMAPEIDRLIARHRALRL
ncbi:hypothetical protein LNKW23_04420 [Paralimibaculum aggregatum]|uniref:PhiE125 gp8 family phage protein n=1 Tax=Paralimibaculum aggregatum TaxID=3036245 RepID=A0ABQ6LG96_9RHOB|nr:hypothetical protein [Limibaculum sp. NKW23]GMG81230.1 hypothetical protein LNKW23_04420 [Limibaculum sp. NKW23]